MYSTLIRLSNTYGTSTEDGIQLNIDMTNNELANFGGTTREGVNRIISDLKSKNIIATQGKRITIKILTILKIRLIVKIVRLIFAKWNKNRDMKMSLFLAYT